MRIIALLFALGFSTQLHAAKIMITGEKFVSELKSGEMVKMMHALGYFHAIEDGLEASGHTCRPNGESTKQTMDGLTSYIQSAEDASRTPATALIVEYLTKTFPCVAPPTQK